MVIKYRDVICMTLFGRHDKNINDATSIYQGYDRYTLTTTGGGVNSILLSNIGTIGFTASPSLYISHLTATNIVFLVIITTLSEATSTLNSIAVNTGGTGWTLASTVFMNGTGTGTTATAAVAAGAITAITMTTNGSGYTASPTISFNGGGFINIKTSMISNVLTGFTITNGGTGFTSPPTIVISGGNIPFQTTTCTVTLTTGAITGITLSTITDPFTSAPPYQYLEMVMLLKLQL
jgi:hypothetical protein